MRKLNRPKQVNGVGGKTETRAHEATVPCPLEDGSMMNYIAPFIPGSPGEFPFPPLYGLDAMARNNACFGIRTGVTATVPDGKEKSLLISRSESLQELLEISDVITIHANLTRETNQMVNREFFNKINKHPILINTSRGQILNLDELYEALKSNLIKAVGTDVLPIEPPQNDHPLIKSWRN